MTIADDLMNEAAYAIAGEIWDLDIVLKAANALDEMAKALQWYIENDDTNEGDEPMPEYGGSTWDEMNEFWIDGKHKAESAIRKAGYEV